MTANCIALATSLRDLAYSAFRSNRTVPSWRTFCKYLIFAKNVIRKEKRAFYCKLFSVLDSSGMRRSLKKLGISDNCGWQCDLNIDDMNDYFVNVAGSVPN
ncbi:hypothetical protein CVS40_6132 [Lucilia cuprina]|nr:hypothetical protein CVS40_6132 [Lucilia cuprina]